jgi:YVTN family beta-propeller protein
MSELPTGTVTFLFTDIEGSTQLLKALGPGYGDALAEHQRIVRAAIAAHHGREVDTQGDSFFVAFGRAKDAVAAAVDAQRDLAAHAWPEGVAVRVRMGLHTGEPRAGGGRYVGLGVHKAARIAAAGHGGQVLLSRTTRDLVEDELPTGVTIRDLGERRFKDLDRPEHMSQLVIEGLQNQFGRLKTVDEELRVKRRRMYAASALVGVLAAAVAIPIFALGQGSGGSENVAPNSVAVIDEHSNVIDGSVAVGVRPAGVAVGAGSVWVANLDDRTLSRVDPDSRSLQRTISLSATPTGLAFGAGAVWVADGATGSVARVDPGTDQVTTTIHVTQSSTLASVAVGEGFVWPAYFGNAVVARIDPRTNLVDQTGNAGTSPLAITVGGGSVWVANSADNTVSRILPSTVTAYATPSVGLHPAGLAAGYGAIWVSDEGDNTVTRIDLASSAQATIPVGRGPTGIAAGADAVWVANSDDGTISKIDPARSRVVATIRVGNRPTGVATTGDRVWVTVQPAT